MTKRLDLTGRIFYRLCVVSYHDSLNGKARWLCMCDCGNQIPVVVTSCHLISGHTKSCGCMNVEINRDKHLTHGGSSTLLYRVWQMMKNRCHCQTAKDYPNYGGRGISVSSDWLNYENFAQWALQSGYQKGLTLERVDCNGNYSAENCRWITKSEQTLNTRRTRYLTAFGETKPVAVWASDPRCVVNRRTLNSRIYNYGWDDERAIATPSKA